MMFARTPPHQVLPRVSCALKRRESRSPVYPLPTVRPDTESPLVAETMTCHQGITTGTPAVMAVPVVDTPTVEEVGTEEVTANRRLRPPPPMTRP